MEFLQKSVEVYLGEVMKQLQKAAKLRRFAAPVCSRTTLYPHLKSYTGPLSLPCLVLSPTPNRQPKPQTDQAWLLCCPSTHTDHTHTHTHTGGVTITDIIDIIV